MPNVELKLVDDNGNEVEFGKPGELWLHCPNVMKGYWQNAAATAETLTQDGWLMTGDIAVRDREGYYFIVDRKKVHVNKPLPSAFRDKVIHTN